MPSPGVIACVLVAAWLLATLAYQYSPVQVAVARRDPFKLLPSWAFFAPHPAYRDYHLVVRELRRDGTLGPCLPVGLFPDRRLADLVWNPAKRPRKILQDAMQAIKRLRRWSASEQVVQCSLPYLLLLHYASTQHACGPDAIALQFAVVESAGRDGRRLWISFVSGFHRLSPRSGPGPSSAA
ncbi:hypothetical protein HHL11_05535 [Ramlibacter sp. G-1-2-2]|uniref:Uncharacterized protein n=1 Tax=Ramlibacter agri TaxID=2728837 RepID=A0A848H3F6_9BURK|nr:hypothetical protein [Ramlibacter agri]NML43203.1 hypothetical protein [Ramlibacter agri]